MTVLVSMSYEEKSLAMDAANAADELLELWELIQDDRAKATDLETARKHTEVLIAFGNMVQRKLSPEVAKEAEKADRPNWFLRNKEDLLLIAACFLLGLLTNFLTSIWK